MNNALTLYRTLIDNIDSAILSILLHRAKVINLIELYKNLNELPKERSPIREHALENLYKFAEQLDLDDQFIHKIMQHLFTYRHSFYETNESEELKIIMQQDENRLIEFNRTLERLDMAFCSLLGERMQLVKQVGEYKKQENIKPLDQNRWQHVLDKKIADAKKLNINPEVIVDLYNLIHDEALNIESQIITR